MLEPLGVTCLTDGSCHSAASDPRHGLHLDWGALLGLVEGLNVGICSVKCVRDVLGKDRGRDVLQRRAHKNGCAWHATSVPCKSHLYSHADGLQRHAVELFRESLDSLISSSAHVLNNGGHLPPQRRWLGAASNLMLWMSVQHNSLC